MRKVILASALLSAVGISFATNGDNLIGVSPASRGMGGIGVGMPVGPTDTIFRNPAWMTYYKGFNMSFGGILFFPEVKARSILHFHRRICHQQIKNVRGSRGGNSASDQRQTYLWYRSFWRIRYGCGLQR
jgi:hypothetical protein